MKYTVPFLVVAATLVPNALGLRQLRHRSSICGAQGYDGGTTAYDDSRLGSSAACAAWCQNDSSCQSYAYGSGKCLIYNVSVAGNFEDDSDSPYLFYDRACVPASSATTATAASTTTTFTTKTSSAYVRGALSSTKTTSSTYDDCESVTTTSITTATTKRAITPTTLSTTTKKSG